MRVPFIIAALIASFVIIQFILFSENGILYLVSYALYPARFETNFIWSAITLLTHSFLHGGWGHTALNSLWLLAFGTLLARRLGWRRFILFYSVCVMLAGAGQVVFSFGGNAFTPIIGASGGVAACMGAAMRFMFTSRDPNSPLLTLRQIPHTRPVFLFILIWLIFNLIFGLTPPLVGGDNASVAWQAHMVGFFAGLLLLPLFDAPPRSPSGGPGNVSFGNWRE